MMFPLHWLVVLFVLACLSVVPIVAFLLGRKMGDQAGYIRGYKEGQQNPHAK
jgi:hypothetical protein